jgi:hypothetical protein
MLDVHNAYYHSTITSGYGKGGAPDILACVYGFFVGIECKAGDGKATALQEAALKAIGEANGWALIINEENYETLQSVLELLRIRKR